MKLERDSVRKDLLRVLLIESQDSDSRIIEGLIRHTDIYRFTIVKVSSLTSAIEYLDVNQTDVVLLDLDMDDSKGPTTTEFLHRQLPRVAVVGLTSDQDAPNIVALQAGGWDVICKQFVSGDSLVKQLILAYVRQAGPAKVMDAAGGEQLSELQNRRRFVDTFGKIVASSVHHEHTLALIDVESTILPSTYENFGDAVLQYLGQILARELGVEHEVFRYGGEEFAILMKDTIVGANERLGAMLRTIESESKNLGNEQANVSFSVGVTNLCSDENYRQAIQRCDKALSQAKQLGQKQVVVSRDGTVAVE
jgi:diguanylate cyclase (GGDEF)-like protein